MAESLGNRQVFLILFLAGVPSICLDLSTEGAEMKLRPRTTFALAGATVALAAGAGGALAAGGDGGDESGTGGASGFAISLAAAGPNQAPAATAVGEGKTETGFGAGPGLVISFAGDVAGGPPAAIASYLGLTEEELRAQLESRKTLAQIASAQGKPVSGLEDVIYADAKTHLDQAVADGKLPADQEPEMLAELKSHLDELVNSTGPKVSAKGAVGGPFGEAPARYLGLTTAELQARLESGKTLAQVAADQGRSVAGLNEAILAGAKTELNAAVAAGKMTAAQEQAMLADLESHLDDLVNGPVLVRTAVRA
jgi:hypothetical protein